VFSVPEHRVRLDRFCDIRIRARERTLQPRIRGLIQGPLVSAAHWFSRRGYGSVSAGLYSFIARLAPNEVDALYYQVQTLTQKGETDAAAEMLRTILERFPDFADGHFECGCLLQRSNRDGEALESFDRALCLKSEVASWHAARGFSLLRLDRFQEAEVSFRRAIRHDAKCSEALCNLGVLMSRLGRADEAIDWYRAAIALGADCSVSVSLAHLLEAAGRVSEAEDVVREGLRHDPFDPTLTSLLASVLRGQGRMQDALDILRSAEVEHPSNLVVLATLIEVLVQAGHHQEAVSTAQRLSISQPGTAAQAIMGWTYLETGHPSLALDYINAALGSGPDEENIDGAELRGLRAAALASLGEHLEAEEIFGELERDWPEVLARNPDLRHYGKR